ncbi:MAG: hypothetical protein AAGA48_12215 [Myxococcota bacterium]
MAVTPRVVLITRPTPYEAALAVHGTEGQARFVLAQRGVSWDALKSSHQQFVGILHDVVACIPLAWHRTRIGRDDLDRFLFEDRDMVVVVGQDGLVANVARFLHGQPVVGVDGAPGANSGVLVVHDARSAAHAVAAVGTGKAVDVESRTLVEVTLDDGQTLRGLNEVFVGHRTHQSARYHLTYDEAAERQSSSGVVVATGTGSTGWAASIHRERRCDLTLPDPCDAQLAFFVREAWPGPRLGAELTEGLVGPSASLQITSEMDDGGVIFADGIEVDALRFGRGQAASVGCSPETLQLVVG